jgi:hypothetical protein
MLGWILSYLGHGVVWHTWKGEGRAWADGRWRGDAQACTGEGVSELVWCFLLKVKHPSSPGFSSGQSASTHTRTHDPNTNTNA